jgi:hypothetical protein
MRDGDYTQMKETHRAWDTDAPVALTIYCDKNVIKNIQTGKIIVIDRAIVKLPTP